MVIIFASEKARKQLLEKGYVWSFRVHKRALKLCGSIEHAPVAYDWMTDNRCGKKLCDVVVQNEKEITDWQQLKDYVFASGFDSLNQWIIEIFRLNHWQLTSNPRIIGLKHPPEGTLGWLYLVQKLANA